MPPPTTIIFGPTGGVASAAARSAQEHGAKVILAMRDPLKPIPGFSPEQEKEAGFTRVQADLTKPDTVGAAAHQTGAKRAFIYLAHGVSDHMKSTITALKAAGVDFVVFLSSFSVSLSEGGDISKILPSDIIPYEHGHVELVLAEIFGADGYIAVRPAFYASNAVPWKVGISSGELKLVSPDAELDFICPADIGRVCGALLARGPQAGQGFVNLCGPDLVSQREAAGVIARAVGREVQVVSLGEEEGVQMMIAGQGMPEVAARYLVRLLKGLGDGEEVWYERAVYEEARENVRKLAGREPTRLGEWVEENKGLFA